MRGSGGVGDGVQRRRIGMAHRCSEAARRSGTLSRRCAARAAKRYGETARRSGTVKRHREASAPIRRSASAASASGCRMARTCAARRLGRSSGVGRLDASRPHANRHTRCRASSPRPRCLTRQRVVDVTLDAIESMRMHASSMGRLAARIMRAAGKRSRFRLKAAGGSAAAPGADGEALVGQTSSSGVRLSDSSSCVLHFFTFDEAIFHAICNANAYTFATPFGKRAHRPRLSQLHGAFLSIT
ncbi:hypothetical protein BBJ_821 [Burkholderia pseudomallei NCTC 13178]|nr:hypothetical protein BBJ_821 [Burkholderia pseudomallei NCTC 13178]